MSGFHRSAIGRAQRHRLLVSKLGCAVAMALTASMAFAQDAAPGAGQEAGQDAGQEASRTQATTLDAIQVTAQFRSQSLQETPIAISALNAEMMEARGQLSVLDVASAAPNVNIKPTAGNYGSGAAISIRGVGQYDSSFALEPGVGIYIDDVYHPTIAGSVFDLLDLERVEILRGPQGTLAGKNSIGGAIKLYSRVPDDQQGGMVEATVGSFGRIDLRSSANFVLKDNELFLRLSGVSKKRDGHVTRYDYGCRNPGSGVPSASPNGDCVIGHEGGESYQGVRAALRWAPSEAFEANFALDASDVDNEAPGTIGLVGPDSRFLNVGPYENYATYQGNGWSASPTSTMKSRGASAKLDWRFGDNYSLTSITSYREYEGRWGVDMDRGPIAYYTQQWLAWNHTFSQELRFNGAAFDDRLEYTVGGYYFDATSTLEGIADIPRLFAYHEDPAVSKSKSVFAHAMYKLSDNWDLSAGVRFTDESKQYTFVRTHPVTGLPVNATNGQVGYYEGDRVDYRLAASYHLNEQVMLYASYATGFKGGGINPRPFSASQVLPFNPEVLKAYEFGVKADLFDRSLRLNTSVFLNDYTDILMTITNGYAGFPVSAIPVNAGEADVRGAEIELTAYPIEGLMIDASYGYLDFEYKELSAAALASRMDYWMVAPYMSKNKASLGIQYEIPFSAGSLIPRVDASYYSDFFTNASNSAVGRVDGATVANARLTWRPANADWEAAVGVTNLTDRYYYNNKIDVSSASNVANANPARPREWFVSFRHNF